MHPAALIQRKRDGGSLAGGPLRDFLDAYLRDEVADYQMSAMLMAIFFRGLSPVELDEMTSAVIESGRTIEFGDGPPAVDKHSTGGVGDKVSLVLAPLLAEYGLRVPMMSGRGLGHTGGTLDKLEAIPGFRTDLDLAEFERVVADVGCAMIGQTPQIAPLDGRLYALRDVTGTVESIPLIASSIVSKKVAEGIGGLVLDVKIGRGAFMPDTDTGRRLAQTMVRLAESRGLQASALLTRMDAPLGSAVGNALEVREALDCLGGGGPDDLRALTLDLAVAAAVLGEPGTNPLEAHTEMSARLDDGRALERFGRLIECQGGDRRVIDNPAVLGSAPVVREVPSPTAGWVGSFDARTVGQAAVTLGAGRRALGDPVDPLVGFEILGAVGERVDEGDLVARVHARDEASASKAVEALLGALSISGDAPDVLPLVLESV